MRLISFPAFASLALASTVLQAGADPATPTPAKPLAPAPGSVGEASYEYSIATAARLAAGDLRAELTLLTRQLETLQQEAAALRRTRQTKEAELARLSSAGGSSAQTAQLRTEIDALLARSATLDAQIQAVSARIQALQAQASAPAQNQVGPAKVSKVPTQPSTRPTSAAVPVIPREKIDAAAVRLGSTPAVDATAARAAAVELLSTRPSSASALEIEQLALVVTQRAEKTNEADLRALLEELKEKNDQKEKLRAAGQATNDAPDNPNGLFAEDRRRLLQIQERQTKLERVIIELAQTVLGAKDPPAKSPK